MNIKIIDITINKPAFSIDKELFVGGYIFYSQAKLY